MQALSQLRRGRRLQTRAKRSRLRRTQPRYGGKSLRSQYRAAPKIRQRQQPYLSSQTNIADLL